MPFDIKTCARPNILTLEPYRCARDDYKDDGTNILLDANENAFGPSLELNGDHKLANGHGSDFQIDLLGLNRYPDPFVSLGSNCMEGAMLTFSSHQHELKQELINLRNTHIHTKHDLTPENLFVGVGSDEAIDALLRAFCRPGHDKMLNCPPTYGMYKVSAHVNDVEVVQVPLDVENDFALQPDKINATLASDPLIKIVYLCSPGNPTSTLLRKQDVQQVLEHPTWNGVVVLDEAYIDFAPDGSSLAEWVAEWPNLVVTQTLSKAFGMAGIRLGAAFTSPQIALLLNSLKGPYNISNPTSQLAIQALQPRNLQVMHKHRAQILEQRARLEQQLPQIPGVGRFLGTSAANFLLVEMLDSAAAGKPSNQVAQQVYERLAQTRAVVVRFRGKEYGCLGALRITVGTAEENTMLLRELRGVLEDVHSGKASKPLTRGPPDEVDVS